ncbi:MAG: maltose alpha-D-glucosyltransferase, partial [Chloroflexota bacterium]
MPRPSTDRASRPPGGPDWYKDAVIYEVHVRAFRDSNGDGSGDFRGLTEKLDYLADLGVTALWLLPFFPSPGRDDGYDTSEYTAVHPDYGTLADVRTFIAEAHRRGLRVIAEVVLNHTSDQHLWFQRARRAPRGSPWREFYVWSDTPDRYPEARVIFRDFEASNWAWDPVAGAYYWHRFYAHQPDLNYENPRVRQQILRVVEFWLDLGMDGLRLDAVPYLHEADGTNCENLPATHAFLRELRRHVDERYGDRMLLAEANQWPEDAVEYFGGGAGDECHMAFHFPLMPRIFMALRTEDRFPILDILEQTPPIPETAQWAIFLRNHDELTLEMVTDVERDYMYRAYASDPAARINLGIRRRLAPLAGTRRRLELLNGLLFSLPGTPVLYYGDEIGMGDNYYLGDRNAVRTPRQWSPDRNAGFSEANRQRLYMPLIVDPEYHFEAVNVAAQAANPSSLLWWMRRVIGLRQRHPALARGSFEVIPTANRHVLAYRREHEDETIIAVANLSRYAQWFDIDLARDAGRRIVELFGGTEFPPVTTRPYPLVLGPHSFLWFRLETADEATGRLPVLVPAADGSLAGIVAAGAGRGTPLATALAQRLARNPAYRLQGTIASSTRVAASHDLELPGRQAALLLVAAETRVGEVLTVPLVVEAVEAPPRVAAGRGGVIARLRDRGAAADRGVVVDASSDARVARWLGSLALAEPPGGTRGSGLRSRRYDAGQRARDPRRTGDHGSLPTLRLVGRIEPAPLPEIVMAHALGAARVLVEPVVASLEAVVDGRPSIVGFATPERGGGRPTFADEAEASLDRLLDAAVAEGEALSPGRFASSGLFGAAPGEPDDFAARGLADIVVAAQQVGESLAALHDALARPLGPAPEPFTS